MSLPRPDRILPSPNLRQSHFEVTFYSDGGGARAQGKPIGRPGGLEDPAFRQA